MSVTRRADIAHGRVGKGFFSTRLQPCRYSVFACRPLKRISLNTPSVGKQRPTEGRLPFFLGFAQFYRHCSLFALLLFPGFLRFAHLRLHFSQMVQAHQYLIRRVVAQL